MLHILTESIYSSPIPYDHDVIMAQIVSSNKQAEEKNKAYQDLNKEYEDLDEWYREEMEALYEYITDGDPFSTDWAKSIYAQYGVSTGSSPTASGLDSYAAANAMRQNAALKSKADAAILEYNQTYIENRRQIIEDTYKQRKQALDSAKNTLDLKYQ